MQPSNCYMIPDSKENICIEVSRVGENCILFRFSPLSDRMPFNATAGLSQRDAIALSNALSAVALGGFERAVSAEFLRREAAALKLWSTPTTLKPSVEML